MARIVKQKNVTGVDFKKLNTQMEKIWRAKQAIRNHASTNLKLLEPGRLSSFAYQKGKRKIKLDYGDLGAKISFTKQEIQAFNKRAQQASKQMKGAGKGVKPLMLINRVDKTFYKLYPKLNRTKHSVDLGMPKMYAVKGAVAEFAVTTSLSSHHPLPYHKVMIRFERWIEAIGRPVKKVGIYTSNAAWAGKQEVSCHCDCDDWRFRYAYKGHKAGYGIVPESAYPKIRNPSLRGSVCIHILRVLQKLQTSNAYSARLGAHMKQQSRGIAGNTKRYDIKDPIKEIADESAKLVAEMEKTAVKAIKQLKKDKRESAKIAKIRKEAEDKIKVSQNTLKRMEKQKNEAVLKERKSSLNLLISVIGKEAGINAFAKAHPDMTTKQINNLAG